MRAFPLLPLICGMIYAAASAEYIPSDVSRRGLSDQFIASMAKQGHCVLYIDPSPNDGLQPCRIWCKEQGQSEEKVGCLSDHIPIPDGVYPTDNDGYKWQPGDCVCADQIDPIAKAFVVPVIEALAKLDEIICAVFTQAIVDSIEIGFALVPGVGQAATAARQATKLAVEGAKSFAENGLGPTDYFDDWVSKSCGLDKIELGYDETFDALVNAPDSVGTSVGCKQKNKKSCKNIDPKPDPPKTKKDDGPTSTKMEEVPATTEQPKATTAQGPKTTSTTSTISSGGPSQTPVNCELCSSPKSKKAARDARWGSMFEARAVQDSCLLDSPRVKGEDACPAEKAGLKIRDGPLEDRDLTKGEITVNINGGLLVIKCGSHKPCADAQQDSNIDKYFYLENDSKCGGEFRMGESKDVEGLLFQNDHVYEKQTLGLFFEWLGDGKGDKAGTTTKPNPAWVADVLLNQDSNRPFLLVRPGRKTADARPNEALLGTPSTGATVDDVMAYGVARSDPVSGRGGMTIDKTAKNFALVEDRINQNKGTFFKLSIPEPLNIKAGNQVNKDRDWIRTHAGVFQYLRFTPQKKEPIWNKWMRVSNWIDLVLHEFDVSYPWGTHPTEEPKRDDGTNPSLRSLYNFWIDNYLGTIEASAKTWATSAKTAFNKAYGPGAAKAEKDWVDKAFGPRGFARSQAMEFPRPGNAASVYGAYGNPAMTFDAAGNQVTLGAPAAP